MSTESEANAAAASINDGPAIHVGPCRSTRWPISGVDTATDSVIAPNAYVTDSRDHENSSESGLSNSANVMKNDDAKKTPTLEATTTRHP